jgi:type IV pilus assembly protein PilC
VALDFRYTARSGDGRLVRGTMQAAHPDAVLAALRTRALFVTSIESETRLRAGLYRSLRLGGPRQRSLGAFFRSFAMLIRSGVVMRRALSVTIERCDDSILGEALRSILADVEHGTSLSDAMARRPRVFPPLHVAMIRAGETGGLLDDVVERLALLLERESVLRKKVQAALAYPIVVFCAAGGLVLFLLARIVPMFSSMFESFHVEIPATTRVLLTVGEVLQHPFFWLIGTCLGVLLAFFLHRTAATASGALILDRLRFATPIAGTLMHKAIMARVSRMLATLLRSGIELLVALDAVTSLTGSPLYTEAFGRVNVALRSGDTLVAPLTDANLFDPLFLALVRVGEETGTLDEMLLKIADYYESDVESTIAVLGAVIEPALIIFLGGIVGFIVFSIFIPLYSLIGSISK